MPNKKRLVIIESPYAGDVALNEEYARACVRDALCKGEAPIASHLLYTQPDILDDLVPEERAMGIAAGLAWLKVAEASVVYADRGISAGMQQGIRLAIEMGVPVEYRGLDNYAQWIAAREKLKTDEILTKEELACLVNRRLKPHKPRLIRERRKANAAD